MQECYKLVLGRHFIFVALWTVYSGDIDEA